MMQEAVTTLVHLKDKIKVRIFDRQVDQGIIELRQTDDINEIDVVITSGRYGDITPCRVKLLALLEAMIALFDAVNQTTMQEQDHDSP